VLCVSPHVLSRNSAAKCLGVGGGGRDVARSGESNPLDSSFTYVASHSLGSGHLALLKTPGSSSTSLTKGSTLFITFGLWITSVVPGLGVRMMLPFA